MARITSIIHGHLSMAPRPIKEADSLSVDGHDVTILGCWHDAELAARDMRICQGKGWKFIPVIDLSPRNRWYNLYYRLRTSMARRAFAQSKYVMPDLFGYGTSALLREATRNPADLTIVHSEGGMFIGEHLLKKGYRVGVDFEDWFSEDLPKEARAGRPVQRLQKLEEVLIKNCTYCLAPSQAMAKALSSHFDAPLPEVVYNCFPDTLCNKQNQSHQDRKNTELLSLHWFSQTIGPGRGLETLFKALENIREPLEVHLRGAFPERYRNILLPLIPEFHRTNIHFHETVPTEDLPSRIAEHDIGLALERESVQSRDLTITNKLFQYMEAGLAVIATATQGQREVLESSPDIGILVEPDNPESLSKAIQTFLDNPQQVKAAQNRAISASGSTYNFSIYSDRIRERAKAALSA